MSRSRTPLVIVLIVFSVGALGLAWWQHATLVRTQVALAIAQQRIEELQRKRPQLPAPEMAMAPSAADISLDAAAEQPPEREIVERRGGPGPGGGRMGRAMLDLSSDPEIAPLLLNQRKRAMANRYAALLARLGLPPAQAEQLTTLLAEKQLSHADAQLMSRSQGLRGDDAREMAKLADAESDAAIKSMLGEAGYAELQNFDRTYGQRSTVNSLAQQLNYAGAPLPAAQQEQLIQILAANKVTAPGGSRTESGFPGGGFAGATLSFRRGASEEDNRAYLEAKATSDAAVLQQASAILTPKQLAQLQQMQQEANEQLKLNALTAQRMRQLRSEGGGRAGGR